MEYNQTYAITPVENTNLHLLVLENKDRCDITGFNDFDAYEVDAFDERDSGNETFYRRAYGDCYSTHSREKTCGSTMQRLNSIFMFSLSFLGILCT